MAQVDWAALKTSKWQQINGSDPERYRTWGDSGVQVFNPPADDVDIPDTSTRTTEKEVDETDSVEITESVDVVIDYTRDATESVDISEDVEITLALGREGVDDVDVTEDISFDLAWVKTDDVDVTEDTTVSLEIVSSATDSVDLTEDVDVQLSIGEEHSDDIDIAEEVSVAFANTETYTDDVEITDELEIELLFTRTGDEAVAISEDTAFTFGNNREEWVDVEDEFAFIIGKLKEDGVGITEDYEIVQEYGEVHTDEVGIAEEYDLDLEWTRYDPVAIDEAVAFEVSWDREDSVDISEAVTVVFQMQEVHEDTVVITDEARIVVWDTSESGGMSLVDDVRVEVQNVLSLTDEEVADLSIHDLLHLYWSAQSNFTPAEAYSILDHVSTTVVGSHYIRDVHRIMDSFNREDGPIGSNWTMAFGTFDIVNGKVQSTVATAIGAHNTELESTDHYAEADVNTFEGSTDTFAVIVRYQDGSNFYMGRYSDASNQWQIWERVGGTYAMLQAGAEDLPPSNETTLNIRLEVQGNQLRLYSDGVLKCSVTDSTLTTGTQIGLRINDINNGAGVNALVDNFRGGTL